MQAKMLGITYDQQTIQTRVLERRSTKGARSQQV